MTALCSPPPTHRVRTDLARNVAGLGALWVLYSLVRSIAGDDFDVAMANAERVLAVQDVAGFAWEAGLQELLYARPLFLIANVYYLVHFPVTVGVLGYAFWRHRFGIFPRFRGALVLTTLTAMGIHVLFPLAPPRMLDGFLDTGAVYGPNPYSIPGSEGANQIAAMPSLHVSWALLVALAMRHFGPRLLARVGVLHAAMTCFVVIVTANHFVVDVAAGAAIAAIAWLLAAHPLVSRCGTPPAMDEPSEPDTAAVPS
ncbi:MAG: phosphatase PAP2 family protein [Actinomycetota bacterium]